MKAPDQLGFDCRVRRNVPLLDSVVHDTCRVRGKTKSGEGQCSPFSSLLSRIATLPHGRLVIRGGRAEKPPGAFDSNCTDTW